LYFFVKSPAFFGRNLQIWASLGALDAKKLVKETCKLFLFFIYLLCRMILEVVSLVFGFTYVCILAWYAYGWQIAGKLQVTGKPVWRIG